MAHMKVLYVLPFIALSGLFGVQITFGLQNSFKKEDDKIDLRRELDKMTRDLLVMKDPFYHSYVFNSGVGNREKLVVESIRKESQFTAGEAVVSWQAVRNIDQIHLLGRKLSSVTLVTAAAQLSANRSAQFHEHSISFGANVTSTSLFTRWNPATLMPEVVAVIAIDTSAADILFYRAINGKLVHITQWSRYRKVSCLTALSVDRKNQLIVIDTGSPASIDVFDVVFTPGYDKLDFRLVHSFAVAGECRSATVCRVGRQHYLVLPLPQHLVVYRLVSGHYQKHTQLSLPRVSQVVYFNVALQNYLALNGETAHLLRLTEAGQFVSELMPGHVSEWLVLPVSSYRSDVLLLRRTANMIKAYVWAGANRGFDDVAIPHCTAGGSCLAGDWSGAVSVPFHDQNYLLIPQSQQFSSLVMVGTSLLNKNPVLDKLKATVENMKKYQEEWQEIKSKMANLEETLRYVVKKDGINVITGKWTIERLEGLRLRLSSLVRPQTETNVSEETAGTEKWGAVQLETLESLVKSVMDKGIELINAVEQRENEAWGLNGFRGKVTFNGRLIVDNLTVSQLNNERMDRLLLNTFRKDKPELIQQPVVFEALEAEDIVFNKINNFTSDNLKFSDGPVTISGDVTFECPLTVGGEVELEKGGKVNGVNLSEELCHGEERCSVFPMVNLFEEEVRDGDLNNNIDNHLATSGSNQFWSYTVAGHNLTVVKINGVDWKTLTQNVVYRDAYQNITGTVVVKGKVSSNPALWADSIQHLHKSQPRAFDSSKPSPILEAPQSEKRPASGHRTIPLLDELHMASELIITELEVTGTVSCEKSEWGAEAANVVFRDANPILIEGDKTFIGAVNVTNNAEVEGTVGGIVVSDLLSSNTDQVFTGPTTLHGDITLENVTLTGLWNRKNLSDVMKGYNSYKYISGREIAADSIKVLETINGVPVSDIVFTDDNDVTKVKTVDVERLSVTKDVVVDGEVCKFNLDDFNERRLSYKKDQNISGKVSINRAKISTGFEVKKINNVDISSFIADSDHSDIEQTFYLSELHVDGDILTSEGVNGFNLSDVAANAVWLEANNEIEGPLVFKDEIAFDVVECTGFCNQKGCDHWLDVDNVVLKNNKSVTFSGKKRFINLLNISEDLTVQKINGHKIRDILTKTTEQEITGNLIIDGDVRVAEDSVFLGLLNGQNLTEFGHRCSLSKNTIICKGNTVFNDNVVMQNFNTSGKLNEVKFDNFMKSVVRTDKPQQIKGFKRFTGNRVKVESIEDVHRINGESWDGFLSDSVSVGGQEQVDHPVTFTDSLAVGELSVDYHMEVDTINEINITGWKSDAIYINESHPLEREVRLESASSMGNLSIETYGGLDLEHDVVKLHRTSNLPYLRAKGVTVTGDVEIMGPVNNKYLQELESNTLKTQGDQTIKSDVLVTGNIVVDGNLDTQGPVNERNLRDVITLASDQTLHGKFKFDCIEAQGNFTTTELISGINVTSWTQTGVMKDGREQMISGEWRVQGDLVLQGPVMGRGRLAGVELNQLSDNITRDYLDVHRQMKSNLTEACEEANAQLASARAQPCELQYLDVTQTLPVPSGPSLVAHFKDSNEDYFLVISEKSCTTAIYKWNKNTGTFASLHREVFRFSLKNFIILDLEQMTYVVTVSSEFPSDCEYSGKHLWIFMNDHFKHVSRIDFFVGDLFQGERNTLYEINHNGMFKFELYFDHSDGKAGLREARHRWNITTDVPREWSGAVQYEWLSDFFTTSNCGGEVISVSVDPGKQFVAVASAETSLVPRHADYIKVYRQDGRLFDKLLAQRVNQLQWLSVPAQTWLVALHNRSTLNLYQLQGPLLGFQLQVSATTDATNVTTLVLPLASKVSLQPFIILQSSSAIKIVRAFVQGDPYLGINLTCSFDQVMIRVPRN